MSKKQKKDKAACSTRQLMGIEEIKDYCIATRMGNLVFFIIKPTNISVLPDSSISARIYALLNVVKGQAEIEMLALNSKESFENNKAFYRQRANEEELPVIRKLLEQDSKHLDRIQVLRRGGSEKTDAFCDAAVAQRDKCQNRDQDDRADDKDDAVQRV